MSCKAACIYVAAMKQDLLEEPVSTDDLGWTEFCDQYEVWQLVYLRSWPSNLSQIVEGILACSAKLLCNVEEVIHIATKGVLYPRGPLVDIVSNKLKPAATLALRRIFCLCDKDFDGYLNQEEMNYFQVPLVDP